MSKKSSVKRKVYYRRQLLCASSILQVGRYTRYLQNSRFENE